MLLIARGNWVTMGRRQRNIKNAAAAGITAPMEKLRAPAVFGTKVCPDSAALSNLEAGSILGHPDNGPLPCEKGSMFDPTPEGQGVRAGPEPSCPEQVAHSGPSPWAGYQPTLSFIPGLLAFGLRLPLDCLCFLADAVGLLASVVFVWILWLAAAAATRPHAKIGYAVDFAVPGPQAT